MQNNLRESALMYAKLYGIAVFPLKPRSKAPATDHGFKDATTDPEQIKKWWNANPNFNIGWRTGNASGGAVVIDLDEDDEKDKHGYDTLRKWEQEHHATLPETWAVMTGRGGYHLIYREPNTQQSCSTNLYEGVDIRANGGYGILPPSIHPNGNPYQWEQGAGDGVQIAPVNEVVREFLKGDKSELVKGKRFKSPKNIPEGQRTDILVRELCSLHSKGLSDNAIKAAIREENEEKCEPPLTEQELEKEVFPALSRYEKGTPKIQVQESYQNTEPTTDINAVKNLLSYKYLASGDMKVIQSICNMELVLENDSRFSGKTAFDEFSQQTYLMGSVPWETVNSCRAWSSADDSACFSILQSEYGLTSRNDYFDAVKNVAMKNRFHPVRDMLDSFQYDGREHIRGLLPDYLGAEDSEYNFQVMKLWMLGAVSRIYQPGCKFDYTMILTGRQGLGKSTFLNLLALDDNWFCDSLDSLDSDKSAQALMGAWIIELAELKSLTRTAGGADSVKRFLSARQDKYRIPYERRAGVFLRQCVFAGTTNKTDFLLDETGNRRFLIIQTGVNEPIKSLFEPEVMDDIRAAWAQAVYLYKTEKPRLVLPESCRQQAEALQEESLSDDGKIGIITKYLEDKQRVCALEIWREALGENGRPQKWQSGEINNIIANLPDWERIPTPTTFGEYGQQRGFRKKLQCSSQKEPTEEKFMSLEDFGDTEIPFE